MLRRTVGFLPPTFLGLIILFASIFKASTLEYSFEATPVPQSFENKTAGFSSDLPPAPIVTPENPLWAMSVVGERLILSTKLTQVSRSQELLEIADKRLATAVDLFQNGNPELGYSVLTKAEKYLEEAAIAEKSARVRGMDTSYVLTNLWEASSRHQEVIDVLTEYCPESARPLVVLTANYPKRLQNELQPMILAASTKADSF